jgi:hypothetical protein
MKENSPVHQLGNFVDRPWGVSEIGGTACRATEFNRREEGSDWPSALDGNGHTFEEHVYLIPGVSPPLKGKLLLPH